MQVLYVIGNGFDLWHCLPTKYDDFYKCAEKELDDLGSYLNLNFLLDDPWWKDFEVNLGKFCWQSFYSKNNHVDASDESFRPSMMFDVEDDIREQTNLLVDDLKSKFQEWIESIELDCIVKKFTPISRSRFLSFNYTKVIQSIYEIHDDLIFHIHGDVSRHDDLILGHGDSLEEEPELDEHGDSNRTMFTDSENAAKYPFYAFQKPVNDILEKNCGYFDSLKNTDVIVVIGHSLNEIDIPYFQRISEITKNKKWIVSYYGNNEKIKQLEQLKKCNIPTENITQYHIDEMSKILTKI